MVGEPQLDAVVRVRNEISDVESHLGDNVIRNRRQLVICSLRQFVCETDKLSILLPAVHLGPDKLHSCRSDTGKLQIGDFRWYYIKIPM